MAKLLIVAVLVVLGATAATVTDAQALATCAQKLVPCYTYLNNATVKPQAECCNPIRDAVTHDLPCLCNLYKDPNVLASLNVNVSEALRISRECGVPTNLSNCNAPTSAPTPPGQSGQSGGNNGGADRIALTGITTLILLLVSIALY